MHKWMKKWNMRMMLAQCRKADDSQLDQLIYCILRRIEEKYPCTESVFLSLPKYDSQERKRILRAMDEIMDTQQQT